MHCSQRGPTFRTGLHFYSIKDIQLQKNIIFFILCVLSVALTTPGYAKEVVYSNHELIRNGGFEEDYRSWYSINCNPSHRAAKDGNFGMYMSGIGGEIGELTFFQNIITPTQLSAASISYDYRVNQWADNRQSAEFKVIISKSKGFESTDFADINVEMISPLKIVHSEYLDTSSPWRHAEFYLDQNTLNAIRTAHQEGYFIFLQFLLTRGKSETLDLNVHIDNLSFKLSGSQNIPKLNGMIAYMGQDPNHHRNTINLLDPNDNTSKTIWTYPDKKQKFQWKDLKWKPDSSELTFVSDFETPFSATYTNIYAITPNGRNLRKISNPPFQDDIMHGDYKRIKVTGKIKCNPALQSDQAQTNTIDLWIKGAGKVVSLQLKPNTEVPFEIDDVAVLGENPDLFEPVVVMHWSNDTCAFGVEYERPVSEISFSKTDIGTLVFDGLVCNEGSEVNSIRNISWQWDGAKIGFAMIGGLRTIDPAGQSIFSTEELLPFSNVKWPDHISWSPIEHHYLYYDYDLPSMQNAGLYFAVEGGEPELLINDAKSTSAAWFSDGKSFLYVRDAYEDKNIYRFDLKTGTPKRLTYFANESIENISVSGDGRHVTFELRNTWVTPIESNLWIMDLTNPNKMWQITSDGKSTNPDWSKTEVPLSLSATENHKKTLNSKNTDAIVIEDKICFVSSTH